MIKKIIMTTLCFLVTGQIFAFSNIEVIKKYYKFMEDRKTLSEAYEMSTKTVSYDNFYSWYKDVKSIEIKELQEIDDNSCVFKIVMIEHSPQSIFGVMSLFKVEMTLSEGKIISSKSTAVDEYIDFEYKTTEEKKVVFIYNLKKKKYYFRILENNIIRFEREYSLPSDGAFSTFNFVKKLGNVLILEHSGYELGQEIFIHIPSNKFIVPKFDNIKIIDDLKIILSYDESYLGNDSGLVIEFYNDKYYGKQIINEGVYGASVELMNGEYWLTYEILKLYGDPNEKKKINISEHFKE